MTLHLTTCGHPWHSFQMGPNCGVHFIIPRTVRYWTIITYANIINQFLRANITMVHILPLARGWNLVPCNTYVLPDAGLRAWPRRRRPECVSTSWLIVPVTVACRRDGLPSRLSWAACLGKQQPLEARMRAMGLLPQGEPEKKLPHDRTPVRVPIPSSHKHNYYTANRLFTIITLACNSYFQY
jgi:hypothetical protein